MFFLGETRVIPEFDRLSPYFQFLSGYFMVKQTQVNDVQNPWVMMEGDCHKRLFILPYIYIHMYDIYIYVYIYIVGIRKENGNPILNHFQPTRNSWNDRGSLKTCTRPSAQLFSSFGFAGVIWLWPGWFGGGRGLA